MPFPITSLGVQGLALQICWFWIATHQMVTTSPGVRPEDLIAIAAPKGPFSKMAEVPSIGPGDMPLGGVQLIGLVIASASAAPPKNRAYTEVIAATVEAFDILLN